MAHIFISYSKQDIDFTRYLRALLEAEGFTIWVDEARLTPSSHWWKSIEANIEGCSAFVVVMTPESEDSDWVEREILLAEKLKRPIFPVLLRGETWSRLANIQYEDLRAGLRAKLSNHFINSLRTLVPMQQTHDRSVTISIQHGDIVECEADVLAFKFARGLHGADRIIAGVLEIKSGIDLQQLSAPPGEYRFVETNGGIPAPQVLYIGTVNIFRLDYQGIRLFAERVLTTLAEVAPNTRHLAMTVHGPGFGLDEGEALRSQLDGFLDAIVKMQYPKLLERITIVEFDQARANRLLEIATQYAADIASASPLDDESGYRLTLPSPSMQPAEPAPIVESPPKEVVKPHAFIAIPPTPDLEDIFYYGIQSPVHARGLLCERIDQTALTEDLFDGLNQRIQSASVVVADLTGADPHVYLQLGLALGKNRPVVLLAKQGQTINFELRGNQPRFYQRIKDVESVLTEALDQLKSEGLL
ncbi:MAG: toll/interleukin-1 receptor domain-containing protein [Anaerolineae bacterium]|nr:toll/interleukin-1 receptor domain-containing protein [Anaerolineae bacterium]